MYAWHGGLATTAVAIALTAGCTSGGESRTGGSSASPRPAADACADPCCGDDCAGASAGTGDPVDASAPPPTPPAPQQDAAAPPRDASTPPEDAAEAPRDATQPPQDAPVLPPTSCPETACGPSAPNCDPATGECLASCSGDADCPVTGDVCAVATGLCFTPDCRQDADCSPPATVCETYACVAGCAAHSDCLPSERCELRGPSNRNHCVPRDCATDADCSPPTTICDTDGLVSPAGGGYCDPGCQTHFDCGQAGYDCDVASGTCQSHDYGDVGADCAGGCDSGFCLSANGNVCTEFCCTQHDCPAGWGCRSVPDGTGGSHTVDVCVPLDASQGTARYDEACSSDSDCRSDMCQSGKCTESCCTDDDCGFVSGMHCIGGGSDDPSYCTPLPLLGDDPMGTLGCTTTGSPLDCKSDMCFTFYIPDTGCSSDAECTSTDRPTCWDFPNNAPDGTKDCVRDMCLDHCCSADDCVGPDGGTYYCGKTVVGTGDYNVCLYHFGTAGLAEGDACTANSQCRSHFCSSVDGVCRRRCCDDSDCTTPGYPNCTLEPFNVVGFVRELNVCTP